MNSEWYIKDGLLSWMDSAEMWDIGHWEQEDIDYFLSLSYGRQLDIINTLEEWNEEEV